MAAADDRDWKVSITGLSQCGENIFLGSHFKNTIRMTGRVYRLPNK
jgi:hypothetical protein|tara:strand:- start:403 stop:540 length:138 start_codon:yes stop_codon:yes gene_type:complete